MKMEVCHAQADKRRADEVLDDRLPYETPVVEELPFPRDGVDPLAPPSGDAVSALPGDPDLELERDAAGDPPGEDGPVAES
jgi:hypothetical protein